jgi:tetratricopeptide (TPR) repeat protein
MNKELWGLVVFLVMGMASANPLAKIKSQIDSKNCGAVANELFQIAYGGGKKWTTGQVMLARQWLGHCLNSEGFSHLAAYPLIGTIERGSPDVVSKSIELLFKVSDATGDAQLLNYATSKVDVSLRQQLKSDVVGLNLGEFAYNERKYSEAMTYFSEVRQRNPKNRQALYYLGLIYLQGNQVKPAFEYFERLEALYQDSASGNYERGVATLSLARTLFQAKMWNEAVDYYKRVPRDHELYRQALFEMAWAQFRAAKFRGAIGTIESLQTPFYDNYFDPESLILKMIIQLLTCQHEDLERTLSVYEKNYGRSAEQMRKFKSRNVRSDSVLKIIRDTNKKKAMAKEGYAITFPWEIPYALSDTILRQAPMKSLDAVSRGIASERKKFSRSVFARVPGLVKFAKKVYGTRLAVTQGRLVQEYKRQLDLFLGNQVSFDKQYDLMKYESLNSKRIEFKNRIKLTDAQKSELNVEPDRNFYWENGFRYWPFKGEFWLDEVGNYQFIGINRCIYE